MRLTQLPTTQDINQFTAKIDQKIGQNDSAWFRYSHDTSVQSSSLGLPGIPQVVTIPNRNYGGSYVHVFSPSLIVQAQFGRTEVGDNATAAFTTSTADLISQTGFSPAFVGNFKAAPGRSFLPASWYRRISQRRRSLRAASTGSDCQPIQWRCDEDNSETM